MKTIYNQFIFGLLLCCTTVCIHGQPMKYYRVVRKDPNYTALTDNTGIAVVWNGPQGQNVANDAFSKDSIPIGFPFTFNGKTYTYIRPCSNGFVVLGGSYESSAGTEYIPNWRSGSVNHRDYIALYQANIVPKATYYKSTPTELIIQYQSLQGKPTANFVIQPFSIQLRLRANSSNVEITHVPIQNYENIGSEINTPDATIGLYGHAVNPQFVSIMWDGIVLSFSDSLHLYNGTATYVNGGSAFLFIIKPSRDLAATSFNNLPTAVFKIGDTYVPKATFTNLGWDSLNRDEPVNVRYEIFDSRRKLAYRETQMISKSFPGGELARSTTEEFPPFEAKESSKGYLFRAIALLQNEDSLSFHKNDTITHVIGTMEDSTTSTVDNEHGFSSELLLLGQNYPNPFTKETTIDLTPFMSEKEVSLVVKDILGRVVYSSFVSPIERHIVKFSAEFLPAGVYSYSVRVANKVHSNVMHVVK